MTAEDIREEAAETAPSSGASDSDDEQGEDAKKTYDIDEGESASGNFEVDTIVEADRSEDEDEDEQSHQGETEGTLEHHIGPDSYGDGKAKDDEEDCPFCLYMKAGECGESFVNWEECINEGEKTGEDVVEKCVRVTRLLTQCMRANADYYGPVLQAEKAMAASVASGDGLDDATAQAELTYTEAVELGAQNAVHEAEG